MKTTHQITIHGQRITVTINRMATRFGTLFVLENDYGEPVMSQKAFKTEKEALEYETTSLVKMLS